MDYEKKYNEALNWMRELYPGLHGATKEDAEHYFPELRESEDERIRKALVDYFVHFNPEDKWDEEFSFKDVLAYLEKQKEFSEHGYGLYYYHNGGFTFVARPAIEEEKQKENHIPWYDYQKSKEAGYTIIPNEEYEQLIKQKEQKPALEQTLDAYKISDERATAKMEGRIEGRQDVINNPEEYGLQKPAENGTRAKIISKASNEKQVVLLSESDGNAEIGWDTRSLEDTKKLLEYGIAFINKQLGTKPAEWSEEDILSLDRIIGLLNSLKQYVRENTAMSQEYKEAIFKRIEQEYSFLKSLPERFNLQPKQEWSEEDERIIKDAIYALEEVGGYPYTVKGLKSLRPQPKQGIVLTEEQEKKFGHLFSYTHWKPSEQKAQNPSKLSKKDKKILLSLHHVMNCADAQNVVKRDGLRVEDVCNFLFSIESNWKPSEEQVEELWNVISYIEKPDSNFLGVPVLLESLYEQLKKLM